MTRLLALLLLLAGPVAAQSRPSRGPVAAQDLPALFAVTGVGAGDVLNLREAPSATAPATGGLAPDEAGVEVVALSPDGLWGLVARPEGGGWARLSFPAPEGPAPGRIPRPLLCLGTEPFWSIRVTGDAVAFQTPEGSRPLRPTGEGAGFSGFVLAFDDDGAALDLTVMHAACSDGMSDRPYGLTAMAWDRRGAVLEGCCTLDVP